MGFERLTTGWLAALRAAGRVFFAFAIGSGCSRLTRLPSVSMKETYAPTPGMSIGSPRPQAFLDLLAADVQKWAKAQLTPAPKERARERRRAGHRSSH